MSVYIYIFPHFTVNVKYCHSNCLFSTGMFYHRFEVFSLHTSLSFYNDPYHNGEHKQKHSLSDGCTFKTTTLYSNFRNLQVSLQRMGTPWMDVIHHRAQWQCGFCQAIIQCNIPLCQRVSLTLITSCLELCNTKLLHLKHSRQPWMLGQSAQDQRHHYTRRSTLKGHLH